MSPVGSVRSELRPTHRRVGGVTNLLGLESRSTNKTLNLLAIEILRAAHLLPQAGGVAVRVIDPLQHTSAATGERQLQHIKRVNWLP